MPFAAQFGGDFLVLDDRGGARVPAVSIWYDETSGEFAPDVRSIAPSFDTFLAEIADRTGKLLQPTPPA